jgi:hypothetical protein
VFGGAAERIFVSFAGAGSLEWLAILFPGLGVAMKFNRRGIVIGLLILGLCALLEMIPFAFADASGQQGASVAHHVKVAVVAMLGLSVLWASIARPAPVPVVPSGEPVALKPIRSIKYESTRAASLRCNLYTLWHHWPTMLGLCLMPLLGVFWLSAYFLRMSPLPVPATLGIFYLTSFVVWLMIYTLALFMHLQQRFPSPRTVRICTSSLTSAGFLDVTPNGARLREWRRIFTIRNNNGDLHFWTLGGGHFIPREAWEDPRECDEFYETARELWKQPTIGGRAVAG